MGLRARPIFYTLVPTLTAAAGLFLYLTGAFDLGPLFTWLISINVVVLPLWFFDKLKSAGSGFRVPEMTLHWVAAAGGAPMSLIAMRLLRHKTLHKHFKWIYLGLLIPWGAAVFFWLSRP